MLTRREPFYDAGNLFFFIIFLCDGHPSESLCERSDKYSLFKYYIMIQQKSNFLKE